MNTAHLGGLSTYGRAQSAEKAILRAQFRLATAQTELVGGRKADMPGSLGLRLEQSLALRLELGRNATFTDTNTLTSARLDATQASLSSLRTQAEAFIDTLIASRDGANGPAIASSAARRSLDAMTASLNISVDGAYIFSGIETGKPAIAGYFAATPSIPRQSTASAFTSAFGAAQGSPGTELISAGQMQAFLDGPMTSLFASPAWETGWSGASDQVVVSRISAGEQIDTSVSANEAPFRKLAEAFTMVADLGVETLGRGAYAAVVDRAVQTAGEALAGMVLIEAKVGLAQQSVAAADTRHAAFSDLLRTRLAELESVDPAEAAMRVTAHMTEVQVAYAITARINGLSLFNFL